MNETQPKFDAPEVELLHQAVISSIFRSLVEGRVKPGERLAEGTIAGELGVSRGPVRRALQEMANQGIVELIPRRGARVANWTITDFENFSRVRLVLEGLAAEQAASRITSDELGKLLALSDVIREAAEKKAVQQAIDADIKFHYQVVKYSGNQPLIHVYELMLLRIKMFLITEKSLFPSEFGYEHALKKHEALCDAFRRKDASLAKQLMVDHINESATGLLSRMRDSSGEKIDSRGANILLSEEDH